MYVRFTLFIAVLINLTYEIQRVQCIYEDPESFIDFDNTEQFYANKFVAHVEGGHEAALQVATEHDFILHEPVGSLPDLYHFEHKDVREKSKELAHGHSSLLKKHPKVRWVKQQLIKSRQKRGYFSDPLFSKQWYLKNDGSTLARCKTLGPQYGKKALDIDVFRAWNKNITGAGVVVSILDDGLEHEHPDLKRNYDPKASHDFNNHRDDPNPRYSVDNINKHGTRCAGEVAAEANNGVCGTGVAFNAKIGGVRMLDGDVTDAVEAGSLSFGKHHIDIYSSSWGPDDDGRTVDGPGPLAKKAFHDGITLGRNGRGSIFVWATGNGGRYQDYCSCDGYINSIYTISIGAVNNCGRKPWYAEECPGTLAVTYSSGEASGTLDKQISTTDIHFKCTTKHTGTSAAAPLAAGIFALVLQANPKLTWRDMQHLVVKTSDIVSAGDRDWQTNSAGHKVNPKYGFGALNAGALVDMAMSEDWKTSPPLHVCATDEILADLKIEPNGQLVTTLETDGCADYKKQCISKIEQVHLVLTLEKKDSRGKLEIDLIGPSGTRSQILRKRVRDTSRNGFQNWAFLTVFHWGEKPGGKWTLKIRDLSMSGGKLKMWKLKFYGTCDHNKKKNKKTKQSNLTISIDDEEICGDVCKKDCPHILSEHCFECTHFCDCTIGECVPACDAMLVADDQLRHCRRTTEGLNYNYIPNTGADDKDRNKKSGSAFSLPVKFAIVCLALVAVSALITGAGYFASHMQRPTIQPKGYHSVPHCTDGVRDYEELVHEEDEDENVELSITVKS